MNQVLKRPTLWQRFLMIFQGFDWPLLGILFLLGIGGMTTMYSVGYDHGTRFSDHGRNMLLAAGIMFVVAQLSPKRLMQLAVPLYVVGVGLLVATALFGITKKGATRWLDLYVTTIQPSEMLKIAAPMMLAWWFQRREHRRGILDFIIAFILLAIPVALVMKQPDLGTSLLVLAAGIYVIFFAGLSWWLILPVVTAGAIGISAIIYYEPILCQPDVVWAGLHDYQKNRVCTLLDPTKDPLGKGFHIIQGMIAIGSGGIDGKGFMQGTQTHLEFIPERTTDFAFAALGEEFGFIGGCILIYTYVILILRGFVIAARAPTLFSRLMAGSITMSFFTYCFINMGMVSGILPVVGVPLPFISYGGTAMVTLGLSFGILMSISKSRRLMHRL